MLKTTILLVAQAAASPMLQPLGWTVIEDVIQRKVCNSDADCAPTYVCVNMIRGDDEDVPSADMSGKGCAPKVVC